MKREVRKGDVEEVNEIEMIDTEPNSPKIDGINV
jgi:hypothetical protein